MWLLTILLVVIYFPVFALLVIYGANLYILILITFWRRKRLDATPSEVTPFVTVQVPLYNEQHVSERVIDAVAHLDYPLDCLQIQILDDSTDETRDIVAARVGYWQAQGLDIEHCHRVDRSGYKAGALAKAFPTARGEYIAIFDADFLPHANFLRETIPFLQHDPHAAFIQSRWEHLNLTASWLTRLQGVALDSHFMIEQYARSRGGFAFGFNGTAGVWRRTAIIDAGGWRDSTLTEDLDLTYRAWLHGWHGLYRQDVTAPAELPPTMTGFRRQQARWQRGSIEVARMLLPDIWRSGYPLLAKIEATIHLLGPLVTPLMAFLLISYPFLLLLGRLIPGFVIPPNSLDFLGPITLAPPLFFITSQILARRSTLNAVVGVVLCQIIGAGMAMNTLRAVIKALLGQHGEFLRTPKFGDKKETVWQSKYHVRADPGIALDIVWGFFALLAAILGLIHGHNFVTLYGFVSCLGSWWVAGWTILPDIRAAFRAKRLAVA